jgi:3-hydroxyisobutyrate dehydrogenase
MAERLLDQGFSVDVWDRTSDSAARLAERGATIHFAAAEAVRMARVVITMLATEDAVTEVMLWQNALESARPEATWAQMGTIGVEATERLIAEIASRRPDIDFVDAPVAGTRDPARTGQLVILASGPDRAQAAVTPVFESLGRRTLWMGAAGLGTRLKLVLNTWLAFEVEAAAEVSAAAAHMGVPYEALLDAVRDGPLASGAALGGLAKMEKSDHSPEFPLEWGLKDLSLKAAATGPGVLPVADAIADRWGELVGQGFGRFDVSAARFGLDGSPPADLTPEGNMPLVPGEISNSTDRDDAERWVTVYEQLTNMLRASRPVEGVLHRYVQRLRFWHARRDQLSESAGADAGSSEA